MKSGFNLNEESIDPEFMKKIQTLLEMFMEDALKASARYTIIKRKKVVNRDRMKLGLQYVARTFFESEDMEERFAQIMNRDEEGEEEDDSEEGEEGEDSEEGEEESEGEESVGEDDENEDMSDDENAETEVDFHMNIPDSDFCTIIERYSDTWDQWQPSDPAQALIKRSIDHISI
tara:strand:+ start:79 stop:603 length:525 start_codon:yes stop_codon:yes gene_type:complete